MRRWYLWVGLIVLALIGFYVAWPAWAGRQIALAVETNDPVLLARKIDFPAVRENAKPMIQAEMNRQLGQVQGQEGSIGAVILGQLRNGAGEKLVQAAVDSLLTPQHVIDMVRHGRDLRRIVRGIREERAPAQGTGQAAGTDGKAANGTGDEKPARKLSLANLKSYRLTGPLSIAIGFSPDPDAKAADVDVEMSFSPSTGWRVTGLIPNLQAN
ncbi:MAG: DUF2939 domain-containing protein [Hyphomicrobiaceae bacterium]